LPNIVTNQVLPLQFLYRDKVREKLVYTFSLAGLGALKQHLISNGEIVHCNWKKSWG